MFKVTARAVLELGSELISSDIIAFYELIKNGFDAGSKRGVEISFDIVLGHRAYKQFHRQIEIEPLNYEIIRRRIEKGLNSDAEKLFTLAMTTLQSVQSATELSNPDYSPEVLDQRFLCAETVSHLPRQAGSLRGLSGACV